MAETIIEASAINVTAIATAVKVVVAVVVKVIAVAASGLSRAIIKLGVIIRSNSPQLVAALDDDDPVWSIDWRRVAIFVGILSGVPQVFAQKLFEFMLGACEKHQVQQNAVSPATIGAD